MWARSVPERLVEFPLTPQCTSCPAARPPRAPTEGARLRLAVMVGREGIEPPQSKTADLQSAELTTCSTYPRPTAPASGGPTSRSRRVALVAGARSLIFSCSSGGAADGT